MEVLRRCPLAIAQRLVHCAIALSTAVLDRVTKTMPVAPLLTNNLDNSKQKTSNLLSPAPPPYSWSLLGKSEGPAPPPSSKISWSFDLAWNPVLTHPRSYALKTSPPGLSWDGSGPSARSPMDVTSLLHPAPPSAPAPPPPPPPPTHTHTPRATTQHVRAVRGNYSGQSQSKQTAFEGEIKKGSTEGSKERRRK